MPLARVIGINARRLRGDATADEVAKAARRYGLNWGTGRISDLEHGRVSPTLPTLIALALALAQARHATLTLGDLVECDEKIELTSDLIVGSEELKGFLAGAEIGATQQDWANVVETVNLLGAALSRMTKGWPTRLLPLTAERLEKIQRIKHDYGEPEARLAREFGFTRMRMLAEMAEHWGRTFSAERDRRAGTGANAQSKGRVARQLKAELRAVLDGDN